MSGPILGIISAIPANTRLKNGYSMHDWVMRKNRFPSFWGRPMSGETGISQEEIEFLHFRRCRIMPMVSGLTERAISTSNGTADGLRAAQEAKALGIPQYSGVALSVLMPTDWSVNHNWMITFACAVYENGYIPGFIGNTDSSKNFNFDRQCSHYVQATSDFGQYGAIYGATEPRLTGEPTVWNPYCPSALQAENIGLWTGKLRQFDNLEVEEIYARDLSILNNMW